jgi:hypothetical protein
VVLGKTQLLLLLVLIPALLHHFPLQFKVAAAGTQYLVARVAVQERLQGQRVQRVRAAAAAVVAVAAEPLDLLAVLVL